MPYGSVRGSRCGRESEPETHSYRLSSLVSTGLDQLIDKHLDLLRGRKVALLCNHTSVNRSLIHIKELLLGSGIDLCCLFGPEHGVQGEAQDMISVPSHAEPRAEIPVHSLYGSTFESLKPRDEWLTGIDVVVVDLQDIGSRYYTYVWTAAMMLEACAKQGIEVLILDRPNPLGGVSVEGPSINPHCRSFVGYHPIAVRHGMTLGELLRLYCDERRVSVGFKVIPLQGWRRSYLYDQTQLPWVLPSPNMPTLDTALVYPGMCLLEGTNLSEGRGTTRPFEIVGAPWIQGQRLAHELNRLELPGVRFRAHGFLPTFQKHKGQSCGGVQLHLIDRHSFRPFATGLALLTVVKRLWPESFAWRQEPYEFVEHIPAIDLLVGGSWFRERLDQDPYHFTPWIDGWAAEESQFNARRESYLLYPHE